MESVFTTALVVGGGESEGLFVSRTLTFTVNV